MQGIHAWRKAADAASSSASHMAPAVAGEGVAARADAITQAFHRQLYLSPGERLEDGFLDLGGGCDPFLQQENRTGDAILLVDRRLDHRLGSMLENASRQLCKCTDPVTKMMAAALLVSEVLGRSGSDVRAIEERCKDLTLERMDGSSGVIQLGALLAEKPGAHDGGRRQLGAGGAKHRSVLLKALADWLELAPCALRRSAECGATWNVVTLSGGSYLVDVLFDPGAMYEEGSARAAAYLARLQPEGGSSGAAAPSAQEDAASRMVRPPWHAEPWEVEFSRRDRAGRGGFGEVFRGTWAGQPVAVKEVKDASPTDMEVCQFILEISLLSGLSHPNIVRFWRGCVDLRGGGRTLLLVTEWMDRSVLSELLHEAQDQALSVGQCLVLALAIARGVAYLHEVGVLHLDLKSPNVLLNSAFQAKLCDFGLAKVREKVGAHTTLRGVSPVWAPPEMFDESVGGITEKADVYSFGIVAFELFTRQLPFTEVSQMQLTRAKSRGQLPKLPPGLDADLADFVRVCLLQRPGGRPAMQGAIAQLQHIAGQRRIDLRRERAQMESQGLHLGPDSTGSQQTKQLEAESREAEVEIVRLRRLLQEEESKLQLLEEQIRRQGFSGDSEGEPEKRLADFCRLHTEQLEGMKFRCNLCMKLFRGEAFAHRHLQERHFGDMLAGLAGTAPGGGAGSGTSHGHGTSKYFDTDVAEESRARMYTDKLLSPRRPAAAGQLGYAFQDAARRGDLEKVQQCVRQGAAELSQTDADGCTPLHLSAAHGHGEVVQYLLAHAADAAAANDSGMCALHLAAQAGQLAACEVILGAGAPPDTPDVAKARTPLHLAAAHGHLELCRALLAHRAAVGARDVDGVDMLHCAARCGSALLCELALSWGAAVNATDGDGWCALHEAARWGDGELTEVLLRRGADAHARTNDGESPLHVVPGGYAEREVVEVLLMFRANVHAVDYDGETPLHAAVKAGDDNLVGAFLSAGSDANSKSKTGATPLDLARKDEIRWLLRSHGARRGGR